MPTKSYRIFWNLVAKEPSGGIGVTAEIPSSWTESLDPTGSPSFTIAGLDSFIPPAITAIASASIDQTIQSQFGADLARAKRESRSGGRTWVVATKPNGHVHARMFVPCPGGVVIASALIAPDGASKLTEIERAFDTVRVAG